MELRVGQPTRFQHCTKLKTLTEMISTVDSDVKVLVISCLTGIVNTLCSAEDTKGSLVQGMTMIGASIRDLLRFRQGMRVCIAPCTPRKNPDFISHSKFAQVLFDVIINHSDYSTYLILSVACPMRPEICLWCRSTGYQVTR